MSNELPQVEWARDPWLVPVVKLIKRSMRPEETATVDQTDCFGLFVVEGEGPCGEAPSCGLARFCERAWKLRTEAVAVASGPQLVVPLKQDPLPPPPRPSSPPAKHGKKPATKKSRWAGTDKYARREYVPMGRAVDSFLAEFRRTLGELPVLPLMWSARDFATQYAHRGQYQLALTASYCSVMRDGLVIVRFWLDTGKYAFVGIVPELIDRLTEISAALGTFRYMQADLHQLEPPTPTPAKVASKYATCSYRVTVRTSLAAHELAKAIRAHWRF